MRDDKTMEFEVFTAVVDGLFGDAIDPVEAWCEISKMNDSSEVHVPGNLKISNKQAKRQKKQAQIGLASNVLGMTAGTAALVAAARNPALRRTIPAAYEGGPITSRASKYLKTNEGRARLYRAGAAGALGLQAANTGGDVVANRVLNREAKKKISKSMESIIAARRVGAIDTETAIRLVSEAVEKSVDAKKIHQTAESLVPLAPKKSQMVLKPAMAATAPKEETSVKKSDDITWTGEISKRDDEKRQVFGWCSVTEINGQPVVDLQNDYWPLEDIENAAYTYVIKSRKGGDMHKRDGDNPLHTADLVESFVVTPEKLEKMGLDPNALPHGWWVGFKVNDDAQWEMVKKNERTGFSVHGSGRRVDKMLDH